MIGWKDLTPFGQAVIGGILIIAAAVVVALALVS